MKIPTFLQVLKQVHTMIRDGEHRYICISISDAVYRHMGKNLSADHVAWLYRERIQRQLGKHLTYDNWVAFNFLEHFKARGPLSARDGRLAWIEDMIKRERRK